MLIVVSIVGHGPQFLEGSELVLSAFRPARNSWLHAECFDDLLMRT